jgi:hypothetical protein
MSREGIGSLLAAVSEVLIPGFASTTFEWGNLWHRPWPNGTAFEWASLAALASEASRRGWVYSFPILQYDSGSKLFPLRNEIPFHHGAQAGHSEILRHKLSLSLRFLQSMVPKVLLQKSGKSYSVFREGCPYHEIMKGATYPERPDILFIMGECEQGYPRIMKGGKEVEFSFALLDGPIISGVLRVVNSPTLPCRSRLPRHSMDIPVAGIVECSVNKPVDVAASQMAIYNSIFSSPNSAPPQFLLTGNPISTFNWPNQSVNLLAGDPELLESELRHAARRILDYFDIV